MKLTKAFSATVNVSDGERAVMARITSSAVDRDGEVLVPQGMNAKDFQKNPVVFFAHNYYTLPVGKVTALTRSETDWTAKVVFASRPESHPVGEEWLPDTLFSLFQQGVLKGFSVGFTAAESRPATDRDIEKYGAGCRRVISKWNLMELSVAPLPCNQEAVALAVSKGVLSPQAAKGIWDVEAKAETPCEAECEQLDPPCEDCPGKAAKHVVAAVPESPAPIPVKRVHFVMQEHKPAGPEPLIKRLVIADIQKRRGRVYAD